MNAQSQAQSEIARICAAESELDFAREYLALAADAEEREAAERKVKEAEAALAQARSPWEPGAHA